MMVTCIQKSIRLIPWQLRTSIKHIPVVAWMQRRFLSSFLEGREFLHTVDAGPAKGLIYPVVLPEDKGVWTGTYELDFVDRLASSVPPGGICFDIGGWQGYFAGVMAYAGASKIYVCEPLPFNCKRIMRLIDLNPHHQIMLEQAAVGEHDGVATFQVMPESSMGKLENSPFQEDQSSKDTITVRMVTLDSLCESRGIPSADVIKIDVEGAEMMVLRGAINMLKTSKPHLFVEAHSRDLTIQVMDFLVARGYAVTTLETGQPPDGMSEPALCHLQAIPTDDTSRGQAQVAP